MTLRSKLLLAQAPLLLALVLVSVAGSYIITSLGRASHRILKDNYRSVLAMQRMKDALRRMDEGAVVSGGAREADRARFAEELAVQEGNITEPGEREKTAVLHAAWDAYGQSLDRALAMDRGPPRDASLRRHLEVSERTNEAIDAILALNQDAMVRKSDEADRTARRFDAILIAVAVAGFVVGAYATGTLTARLLRPVSVLGQAARRIGEGDLVARARVEGKDEIAQLSREFNTMADRLQQYRQSSLGELIEAQQASQAAIDSLPDPVLVVDNDGGLLHANVAAESVFKVDLGKGGKEALRALDPRAREVVERMRQHVAAGKGAFSPRGLEESFPLSTPEGERHFLPRATPVYAEGGAVLGTTVVLQDVTRLQRFDELKNNLVATVAHEFRTPLTSLQMAIHLCVEQTVGPLTEKQADLLHAAREDCARLQAIVDELLDLSRIQAGRVELHKEPLDAEAAVKRALEAHRHLAEERKVSLRSELLPGIGQVAADAERVQLVFGNLLTNAVRHGPEGSTVAVRAAVAGGEVRFEVRDSGPGIPPEYQQAVFEKFFRMPGGPPGGAGLGLFIAKELVEAHGGRIGVESKPGDGATFWFTLPAAQAPN